MGCSGSVARQIQPVSEMDLFLKVSADEEKMKLKVLLLGTGESGKTTFVKQTKLLEGGSEYKSEASSVVASIRWNVIESMHVLMQAAKSYSIYPQDEADIVTATRLQAIDERSSLSFKEDFARDIEKLWQSTYIQQVYERRNEFWILDATPYYMNNVVRFFSNDFEPNEQDIVMMRTRTLGIVVADVVEYPYKFQVVDVGGQRSERRKWIHCFDDVKAMVYMSALSGYNQGNPRCRTCAGKPVKHFFAPHP
jgi:GTPase SAR1 family protein